MKEMRVIHGISQHSAAGEVTCAAGVFSEEMLRQIFGDTEYQRLCEAGEIVPVDRDHAGER